MSKLKEMFNIANELLGTTTPNREARRKEEKNKKAKKARNRKTSKYSLDVDNMDNSFFSMLFNNTLTQNEENSNVEYTKDEKVISLFDEMAKHLDDTNKTTTNNKRKKSIATVIGKIRDAVLNYFASKDTTSSSVVDRYNDNINAIKIIKSLQEQGTKANATQQKQLAKYVGWGGLSSYFNDEKSSEKLKNLLGDDFNSAKRSVNTAFYTNNILIKYMWNVINRLGFEKGRILDPSFGVGNVFRYGSESTFYNSKITGIELDNISAKIGQQLCQSIQVLNGRYEEEGNKLKDESFDLIISNIPFGNIPVFDKEDKDLSGKHVHDYYFLKSLKKVRDKGIIAFITSTGVMDKKDNEIRMALDKQCNFLGAVRLPSGAFSDTSVVSDIIFLQKDNNKVIEVVIEDEEEEVKSKKEVNRSWTHSVKYFDDKELYINEYYINNPEMVIGDIVLSTNQFGECLTVKNSNKLASDSFRKTFKYFPSEIYTMPLSDDYMFEDDELLLCDDENVKNGEFILKDEKIYQRQGDKLIPNFYVGDRRIKLEFYIQIKELVKTIIKEQLCGCSDDELTSLQEELNSLYDTFVKKYGYINARGNKALFNECILYSMISALENYNFSDKSYDKADIFSKRTIGVQKEFIPNDLEDALSLSLSTYNSIDVEFMAEKLEKSVQYVEQELIIKEYVYVDPTNTKNLIYRDEYLSGYVKEKLSIAKEMVKVNPALELNVKALECVQPEYITDVAFNFGSTWIPANIKEDFITETLGITRDRIKLLYSKTKGYSVELTGYLPYGVGEIDWGTQRRDAIKIIEAVLNLSDLTVTDKKCVNGKETNVKNVEQTQLALSMADKWKETFMTYVTSNVQLLKKVTDIYNDIFNAYVEREYSNIFKTLNINPQITLREHQLKGISRIIQSKNNTLLCHSVGTVSCCVYPVMDIGHKSNCR